MFRHYGLFSRRWQNSPVFSFTTFSLSSRSNGSDYTAGGLPASFADDYVLTFSAALSVRPTADPCCHAGARSCILAKKSAEIRPSDPRAASSIIYVHIKQSANSLQQGGIVSDLLPALPGQLAAVECCKLQLCLWPAQADQLYMSRGKRNIVVVGAGWAGWASMKVDDFLRPFLLVALFKPPEELSAGSIGESIIAPLAHYLQDAPSTLQLQKLPSEMQKITIANWS
eukprot:g67623.t1